MQRNDPRVLTDKILSPCESTWHLDTRLIPYFDRGEIPKRKTWQNGRERELFIAHSNAGTAFFGHFQDLDVVFCTTLKTSHHQIVRAPRSQHAPLGSDPGWGLIPAHTRLSLVLPVWV